MGSIPIRFRRKNNMGKNLLEKLYRNVGDDHWEIDFDKAYDEVRKTAYDFWEKSGRPEGKDQEFWLAAEQHVIEYAWILSDLWLSPCDVPVNG